MQGELANDTVLGESQPSNVLTLANLDAKRTDFLVLPLFPIVDNCGVDNERCNRLDNFKDDLTISPDFLRIRLGLAIVSVVLVVSLLSVILIDGAMFTLGGT